MASGSLTRKKKKKKKRRGIGSKKKKKENGRIGILLFVVRHCRPAK